MSYYLSYSSLGLDPTRSSKLERVSVLLRVCVCAFVCVCVCVRVVPLSPGVSSGVCVRSTTVLCDSRLFPFITSERQAIGPAVPDWSHFTCLHGKCQHIERAERDEEGKGEKGW